MFSEGQLRKREVSGVGLSVYACLCVFYRISHLSPSLSCGNSGHTYLSYFCFCLLLVCSSAPINMKVQHVNGSALVVRWARPEVTYHPPILHFLVSYSWTSHDDSYEETHLTDAKHKLVRNRVIVRGCGRRTALMHASVKPNKGHIIQWCRSGTKRVGCSFVVI